MVAWDRDVGGRVQSDNGGGDEKWLNSEYNLQTEPTGVADGLDVRGTGKRNRG